MHEGAALPAWVALAYLISGVCFILALRGLSSPESSQRGNRFGMAGMLLAVGTTLVHYAPRIADGLGGADSIDFAALGGIAAALAISAPTTITEEMALVTAISGVCSAGVTCQTT